MEVLWEGYSIPFRRAPTLSREPIPFSAYCPNSIRGKALVLEVESLLQKGAIEMAPLPSLGYYSRLFVVMKASGSWRPVIDLSRLSLKVLKTPFKMETLQFTLLSVCRGDWMVSIDLKDAYLQIPIHPESRKYLRFMAFEKVYQFKVLCFGLSTAPQVFTRVMALVFDNSSQSWHLSSTVSGRLADSGVLPRAGSSCSEDSTLSLQLSGDCHQLGEVSACSDSKNLLSGSPFGLYQFQGFSSPETSRQAALNWRRVSILRGAACKILAGVAGSSVLSNSAHYGRTAADAVVPVCSSPSLESIGSRGARTVVSRDLPRSSLVVESRAARARNLSRASVSQLDLWSDASDVGWGAHLGDQVVSGHWSPEECLSSINHRELLAMFYALQHFLPLVRGTSVAVFADNTTVLAYLKNQGGTRSAVLNQTAQDLLWWAELHSVTLLPQFIMGRNNVLADVLSRPNQILGSEWTLKLSVFQQLRKRWPVAIDLFAISHNHRCIPYFSPFHDPNSIGTDAILQPWDGWQAYAFSLYALIPAILKKLRSSSGVLLTIIAPCWPQRPWFPELLELVVDGPVALPLDKDLLSQPHIHRQHLGLSRLALHAWRLSSDL